MTVFRSIKETLKLAQTTFLIRLICQVIQSWCRNNVLYPLLFQTIHKEPQRQSQLGNVLHHPLLPSSTAAAHQQHNRQQPLYGKVTH